MTAMIIPAGRQAGGRVQLQQLPATPWHLFGSMNDCVKRRRAGQMPDPTTVYTGKLERRRNLYRLQTRPLCLNVWHIAVYIDSRLALSRRRDV